MSVNTQPFVLPSAGGEGKPINLEKVVSFEKIDGVSKTRPDLPASQRESNFGIQFWMENSSNNVRYLYFTYADATDRDADYDSLLTYSAYVLQAAP